MDSDWEVRFVPRDAWQRKHLEQLLAQAGYRPACVAIRGHKPMVSLTGWQVVQEFRTLWEEKGAQEFRMFEEKGSDSLIDPLFD
jgi:hypothetical protein